MTALRLIAPLAVRALVEDLTKRFEAGHGLPVFMNFALAPDIGETVIGGQRAVVPTIKGKANITGYAKWLIDPNDPLGEGFVIS